MLELRSTVTNMAAGLACASTENSTQPIAPPAPPLPPTPTPLRSPPPPVSVVEPPWAPEPPTPLGAPPVAELWPPALELLLDVVADPVPSLFPAEQAAPTMNAAATENPPT
jgi:hypothetical protein